tara:strand:- start:1579 stop:4674 length:3096 start_codon:yes stop_codon:yes gene_type:complete
MPKLIVEGGVAGHLAHLYDNRELTFDKLKEILAAASKGKLVGTEKTDGFNIYLGFKDGETRAARNKGDMRKGGMNAVDLAMREFAGGPEIKKVYVDAFNAVEAAFNSLSDKERQQIFGPNGEIFYNSEIMGPGASNVVNYDSNIVSIHKAGHKRYDEETDKVVEADTTDAAKVLDRVIDRFEQSTMEKNFAVRKTAFVNLQKLSSDNDLNIVLNRIEKAGMAGDMTVRDFLAEKLLEDINEKFPSLNDDVKNQIISRILKDENALTLTQIYRGLGSDKEIRAQVRDYVQSGNKTISKLIWPIEEAIHDFAVAMLENMESAYILDNPKELDRLKKEVETAIKSIQAYQGPGQEMAHEILAKQLKKIKHLDNITTVAEGFVFEYDGQLYKFTGNFAPINQILGLFRFGRRGVKIPRVDEAVGASQTVAVVPGAFKPPHRGHLDMVKHYADLADKVIVMVSPKARQCASGRDVTQDESIAIWKIYLDSVGLGNVEVIPSPHPSPVRSAYEYVGEDAIPGENVILGTSTKGGDQSRFAKSVQQYAKEGVRVLDPMEFAFDPVGEELSACDFRDALEMGELAVAKFLPNEVNVEDILNVLNLGIRGETEEVVEHIAPPIFFRMIEEALEESRMRSTKSVQSGYKKTWRDTIRMINKAANRYAGGGKGHTIGNPKLKSAPAGGGALAESIYGSDKYEYGYVFGKYEGDKFIELGGHNETKKFYGASIQKPIIALVALIAGEELTDGFLEQLILYTRGAGNGFRSKGKLTGSNGANQILREKYRKSKKMRKVAKDLAVSLGIDPNTPWKITRGSNQQSAREFISFMNALESPGSNEYLQNHKDASNRILNIMKMASTDRQDRREKGGYEAVKVYNDLKRRANDILESEGVPKEGQIKRLYGKGGGTPPGGPRLAKNLGLVIELENGEKYLFSFYSTKPGEKNDIRKELEKFAAKTLGYTMVQSGIYDKMLNDPNHPLSFEPEEEPGSFKMPPKEGGVVKEEDEIEEISSVAGGSVEGGASPFGKKRKPYIEPHMHQDK